MTKLKDGNYKIEVVLTGALYNKLQKKIVENQWRTMSELLRHLIRNYNTTEKIAQSTRCPYLIQDQKGGWNCTHSDSGLGSCLCSWVNSGGDLDAEMRMRIDYQGKEPNGRSYTRPRPVTKRIEPEEAVNARILWDQNMRHDTQGRIINDSLKGEWR